MHNMGLAPGAGQQESRRTIAPRDGSCPTAKEGTLLASDLALGPSPLDPPGPSAEALQPGPAGAAGRPCVVASQRSLPMEKAQQGSAPQGGPSAHQASRSMPCECEERLWTPRNAPRAHRSPLGRESKSATDSEPVQQRPPQEGPHAARIGPLSHGLQEFEEDTECIHEEMERGRMDAEMRRQLRPSPPAQGRGSSIRSRLQATLLLDAPSPRSVPSLQKGLRQLRTELSGSPSPEAKGGARSRKPGQSVSQPGSPMSAYQHGERPSRLEHTSSAPSAELNALPLHFQHPKAPLAARSPLGSCQGTPHRRVQNQSPRPSPPLSPPSAGESLAGPCRPANQRPPGIPTDRSKDQRASCNATDTSANLGTSVQTSMEGGSAEASGSVTHGYIANVAIGTSSPPPGETSWRSSQASPSELRLTKEQGGRALLRHTSDAAQYKASADRDRHLPESLHALWPPSPRAQAKRVPVSGPMRLSSDVPQPRPEPRRAGYTAEMPTRVSGHSDPSGSLQTSFSSQTSEQEVPAGTTAASLGRGNGTNSSSFARNYFPSNLPPHDPSPSTRHPDGSTGLFQKPCEAGLEWEDEALTVTDYSSGLHRHAAGAPGGSSSLSPSFSPAKRRPGGPGLSRLGSDAAGQDGRGSPGGMSSSPTDSSAKPPLSHVSAGLPPSSPMLRAPGGSPGGDGQQGQSMPSPSLGARTGSIGWGELDTLIGSRKPTVEAISSARCRMGAYPGSFKESASSRLQHSPFPSMSPLEGGAMRSSRLAERLTPDHLLRSSSDIMGHDALTVGASSSRGIRPPSTHLLFPSSPALSPLRRPSRFHLSASAETDDPDIDGGQKLGAKPNVGGMGDEPSSGRRRVKDRGPSHVSPFWDRTTDHEESSSSSNRRTGSPRNWVKPASTGVPAAHPAHPRSSPSKREWSPKPGAEHSFYQAQGQHRSILSNSSPLLRTRVGPTKSCSPDASGTPARLRRHQAEAVARQARGVWVAEEESEDGGAPVETAALARASAAAQLRARVEAFRARVGSGNLRELNRVATPEMEALASPLARRALIRPRSFRDAPAVAGYEMQKGQDAAAFLQMRQGEAGVVRSPLPSQVVEVKARQRRLQHSENNTKREGLGHNDGGIARIKQAKQENRSSIDLARPALEHRSRFRPADRVLGREYQRLSDAYVLHKMELGSGQFGVIRKCKDIASGRTYACKTINKKNVHCAEDAEDIRREIACLSMLQGHPAVVHLKDTFEDEENIHMIMDLCRGGDLFDRIRERGQLAEADAARLCRALVEALLHCHCMGIMHRDVKPENILLTSRTSDTDIKLVDFGVADFFQPDQLLTEESGTPEYMAPEILLGSYGPEVDVWSAGVVMYIALSGVLPFWASDRKGLKDSILNKRPSFKSKRWDKLSPDCKELVLRMLAKNPFKRISATEILAHPWIRRFAEN